MKEKNLANILVTVGGYECMDFIVRWKVGQGQPFNQGCNNEIHSHNCYSLSSLGTEVIFRNLGEKFHVSKSLWGVTASHLSQLLKL